MRLVLCSARFSDNLGDGVIADCQRFLMHSAGLQTRDLDLSGRTSYSVAKSRGLKKTIFFSLSPVLKRVVVATLWFVRGRKRAIRHWESQLEGTDLLVFAGGQVLQDDYLNFPLKVSSLIRLASKKEIPIAFASVGVGSNWSKMGLRMVEAAIRDANISSVSVRDQYSLKNSKVLFLPSQTIRVVADPALVAKDAYHNIGGSITDNKHIGLGIAHPAELAAAAVESMPSADSWREFWILLAELLVADGFKVSAFTNGSAEDEEFLRSLKSMLPRAVCIQPRPFRPEHLVKTISEMGQVVTHRLHAGIIAYSFAIPVVMLEWDQKVRGFMELTSQAQFCIPIDRCNASAVRAACRKGRGVVDSGPLKQGVQDEVRRLQQLLRR